MKFIEDFILIGIQRNKEDNRKKAPKWLLEIIWGKNLISIEETLKIEEK